MLPFIAIGIKDLSDKICLSYAKPIKNESNNHRFIIGF
jgi:hypothetical protein